MGTCQGSFGFAGVHSPNSSFGRHKYVRRAVRASFRLDVLVCGEIRSHKAQRIEHLCVGRRAICLQRMAAIAHVLYQSVAILLCSSDADAHHMQYAHVALLWREKLVRLPKVSATAWDRLARPRYLAAVSSTVWAFRRIHGNTA